MVTEFSISTEIKDGCLLMQPVGYINNSGGETIFKEFMNHFNDGHKNVVIDLSKSNVINSIGISFLIEIIDKLNDEDGKLYFANTDPSIEKTFSIMGIYQFAQKAGTVEEALSKLK